MQNHCAAEVVLLLLSLIFAYPGFDIQMNVDHFETFSGDQAVTNAELEAR
jgi:hypothetical protein